MPRVYIPEPGAYIQMGASEEFPGGQVVHMLPGWTELEGEMANHPLLSRLAPEDDAEQERRYSVYQAEQERNEMISTSQTEFYQKAVEVDNERLEDMRAKEEERAQQFEEDQKKGMSRYIPHPDPEAEHSVALTASPGQFGPSGMVATASMVSKLPEASPPPPPSGSGTTSGTSGTSGTTPTSDNTSSGTVVGSGGTTDTSTTSGRATL